MPSLRDDENSSVLAERDEKYPHFKLGVILALTGSICSGFAYLTMRKLGTSISSVVTTMYFGLFLVPACMITSLALGDKIETPIDGQAVWYLFLVGIFGWIAQEGVSKAVGLAPAARMAPINYLQVVMAWVADIAFFD